MRGLRSSMCVALALLLSASASAQQSVLRSFRHIEGEVRDAGVLHVATGTWTRSNSSASLGAGASTIIYNCTSASGYYAGIDPGQVWTASGRIPSTTSQATVWSPTAVPIASAPGSAVGCQTAYTIDGYQIFYCSDAPGATTAITLNFYEQYRTNGLVCTNPVNTAPQATHVYTLLPGDPTPGGNLCWMVTFDLTGAGSPNAPFVMKADGNGSYSAGTNDAFGWSFTFPSVTSVLSLTGMKVAGAPADASGPAHPGAGWLEFPPSITTEAAGYDGTRFDGPPGAAVPTYPANGVVGLPTPGGEAGSDMLANDGLRIEGGTLTPGCYFFGGPLIGPYTNFHLELYSGVNCGPPLPGTGYCFGDGLDPLVTTACPCGNSGGAGRGCASSFNPAGGRLTATGTIDPVLGSETVVLHADGLNVAVIAPPSMCIFLKGDMTYLPGIAFGDGVLCAIGNLVRLKSKVITPNGLPLGGTALFPESGEPSLARGGLISIGSGIVAYYAVYYRNASTSFCPPATFNVTNGYRIMW